MAEYTFTEPQLVAVGRNILLNDSIPCTRGYVVHRNGSGILTLRGVVNNACGCFARYRVTFNGNISIPEDGTPGEISVALSLNGEPLDSSLAIVTPAAVEEAFNVTSTAFVTVPKGCCLTIAVENTSDQEITVANANLVVTREA